MSLGVDIIDLDDDEGKSYKTSSALTNGAALTSKYLSKARSRAVRYIYIWRVPTSSAPPPRPITATNSRVFYAIVISRVPNGMSSTFVRT